MILSCDANESHAGDLGNIATPLFGTTNIDLVDRILTLGDGGVRSVFINLEIKHMYRPLLLKSRSADFQCLGTLPVVPS